MVTISGANSALCCLLIAITLLSVLVLVRKYGHGKRQGEKFIDLLGDDAAEYISYSDAYPNHRHQPWTSCHTFTEPHLQNRHIIKIN